MRPSSNAANSQRRHVRRIAVLPFAPVRITLVAETYPPEHGGAPLVIRRFVSLLKERSHEVTLIRPRQSSDGDSANPEQHLVNAWPFPFDATLRMGRPSMNRLTTIWREAPPSIVHVATQGPLGFGALVVAGRLGIPVSTSYHTNFHKFARHYGLDVLRPAVVAYLRAFHKRAAVTMVPSRTTRDELQALAFERLAIVSRGVDGVLFHPARRSEELRRSWGVGPNDLVLLHVSRLAPEKNIALTLQAFDAVTRKLPNTRLVVLGDGPLRRRLMTERSDALFAGHLEAEELARHYASADLFVFPSLTETFGNVVLEALASGLPVVAFHMAAAGECAAHGTAVLTAPPGDSPAFRDSVVRLALDGELRRAASRSATEVSAQFSWARIGDALERELLDAARVEPLAHADAKSAH